MKRKRERIYLVVQGTGILAWANWYRGGWRVLYRGDDFPWTFPGDLTENEACQMLLDKYPNKLIYQTSYKIQ